MMHLARRTWFLLVFAMGISLALPTVSFSAEVAKMISGMTEEEVHSHTVLAKFHAGHQQAWRISSRLLDAATEQWQATHHVAVHQGPVSEVPVPPPKSVS